MFQSNHLLSAAVGEIADIVDTAISNGNFKILVAALQAADLVTTLKSPGPFTVFAPTDAAFAKLPLGTVERLLAPENRRLLVKTLTYHVVAANFSSAFLLALRPPIKLNMLADIPVSLIEDGQNLRVNDATVVIPDVVATNGIIHAIDIVLLPPPKLGDIVETLINNGHFNTLLTTLEAADLISVVRSGGPYTVFAPTDAAFDKLPPGTLAELLKPEQKPVLINILQYHIICVSMASDYLMSATEPILVRTLSGRSVTIQFDGNYITVNNATLILPDIFSSMGVVHAIDSVLLP